MRIERLELTGFRSYPDLRFAPTAGPPGIFGPHPARQTKPVAAVPCPRRGNPTRLRLAHGVWTARHLRFAGGTGFTHLLDTYQP